MILRTYTVVVRRVHAVCARPVRTRSRCSRRERRPTPARREPTPARLGGVLPIVPKFTVSTENAANTYAAASEHARGARACSPAVGWPFSPTPARSSCRSRAPSTRRTRSRGRRRSARTTTSSRPGRRSARKASRSAGAAYLGDMVASAQRQRRLHQHLGLRQRRLLGRARRRSSTRSATTAQRRSAASPARCSARRRHRRRCARSSPPTTSTCSRRNTARSSTARSTRRRRSRLAFVASTVAGADAILPAVERQQRLTTALAQQLQTVARVIGARSALGAKRQIFFVSMGGFDTHDTQNASQADLLAQPVARDGVLRRRARATSAASTCAKLAVERRSSQPAAPSARRYWIASPRCEVVIAAWPSRSATVRATRRTR